MWRRLIWCCLSAHFYYNWKFGDFIFGVALKNPKRLNIFARNGIFLNDHTHNGKTSKNIPKILWFSICFLFALLAFLVPKKTGCTSLVFAELAENYIQQQQQQWKPGWFQFQFHHFVLKVIDESQSKIF